MTPDGYRVDGIRIGHTVAFTENIHPVLRPEKWGMGAILDRIFLGESCIPRASQVCDLLLCLR